MSDSTRFSRNISLFGLAGQQRIADAVVAIIGVGGIGTHVLQQLVFLGVRRFVLIDPDILEESNLNRVVVAELADIVEGPVYKVDAASRFALRVDPTIQIAVFPTRIEDPAAQAALGACTSAVVCVDDDTVRLTTIDVLAALRLPYFDAATDTGDDGDGGIWYGGRVLFSGYGERCPSCMDLLNQERLTIAAMTDEQRAVHAATYGVDAAALGETGPSVVSLNGVVASLLAMEWMAWTTGLRDPVSLIEYRGLVGAAFVNRDSPDPNCYYCGRWRKATG